MTCPYLEYRDDDGDLEFDHERPFCRAQESFVSPMRADICNDRYDFDHRDHCEVFRNARDEEEATPLAERQG